MFSLLFFAAVSSAGATATQLQGNTVACTAERLRHFVHPTGITQPWPISTQLPQDSDRELGILLSGQGTMLDGYSHWLLVDPSTPAAYVVQRGGFAGSQTIYGPLPVADCSHVPPNSSFKSKLLRSST